MEHAKLSLDQSPHSESPLSKNAQQSTNTRHPDLSTQNDRYMDPHRGEVIYISERLEGLCFWEPLKLADSATE